MNERREPAYPAAPRAVRRATRSAWQGTGHHIVLGFRRDTTGSVTGRAADVPSGAVA